MPNHVHGIIVITDTAVGAQHAAPLQREPQREPQQEGASGPSPRTNVQPGSLGAIVRSFKSAVTGRINQLRDMPGTPFWQRNYWEHIIRNERLVHTIEGTGADMTFEWTDHQELPTILRMQPGGHSLFAFYYVRVTQTDGHMAWLSPVRFTCTSD